MGKASKPMPKPLKVTSLSRSVPKPLKVPSVARSVPKPLKVGQEGEEKEAGVQKPGHSSLQCASTPLS